jgi:proline dehydrogenase
VTGLSSELDALADDDLTAMASGSLPVLRGHEPQVIVKVGLEDPADPRSAPDHTSSAQPADPHALRAPGDGWTPWQGVRVGVDRAVLFRLATSERFEQAVRALPGGEARTWQAARRYVAGRTLDEALATTAGVLHRGHAASVDLFGELVRYPAVADRVVDDYRRLAAALPPPPADVWLSVDLTHLALDADPAGAADRLAAIALTLPPGRRVQVGAEDAARTDAVLTCVTAVAGRGLADRLGATVQANLQRSPGDVDALAGSGVHVRLVKGAYLESAGAHPHGEPTDVAYLHLAAQLTRQDAAWSAATHDRRLQEALLLQSRVPVEQLLGVRPDVLGELAGRGIPTRVYVPYGPDWFRYWMRRVAESRGA